MVNNMNNRSSANRNYTQNVQVNARGSNNSSNSGSYNNSSCEELMRAIMEADFFARDLKLYLDTHPDDTRAVEMYREAVRQYQACKAAFEESFYPLTAYSAGKDGEWDWPEGVWPPHSFG